MTHSMLKTCIMVAGAALSACSTTVPDTTSSFSSGFSFIVIGDTPYTPADDVMLSKAIPAVISDNPPFIIHIGDYKGGGSPCTAFHDDKHGKMLAELSPIPVVYTPGDNEWTDCDRNLSPATGRPYSELARLNLIRARIAGNTPKTSQAPTIERQKTQTENATWTYKGVRFLTVSVAGTNNGRDQVLGDPVANAGEAADMRDIANLSWIEQAFQTALRENARAVILALHADITNVSRKTEDEICPKGAASENKVSCDAHTKIRFLIRDSALAFQKPVLVIHGDTSPFTLNQSFAGEDAPNLWRLNAAGDAGPGYGLVDITRVSFDSRRPQPFSANGMMTSTRPSKN